MKNLYSPPLNEAELVAAYIARYEGMYSKQGDIFEKNEINYWAYEKLCQLVKINPTKALEVIAQVLHSTEDEFVLSNLAAGPLEDLLRIHGASVLENLEIYARQDNRFRNLLAQVDKVVPDDIWKRIEALLPIKPA
jgi:hypothetical protein